MSNSPSPISKIFQLVQRVVTAVVGIVLILLLIWAVPLLTNNGPQKFADINEHFKYASIGGEDSDGIPYWIWKVMPEVFADHLPGEGLTSLGFIQEPDHELPIGFAKSTNRLGLDVVTQNCATCHAGSLRQTPDSDAQVVSAMPSNTVDLQRYIQFLADISVDERFNAANIMPYIAASTEDSGTKLNPLEKAIYRFVAIPQTRDVLIKIRQGFTFMDDQTPYGPGRVDTFTSYKSRRFNFPVAQLPERELAGIADFPSIWEQGPREGMKLHWDGNNDSIDERNKSAALALVQPTTINLASIHRIRDWLLDLPAPQYPASVDPSLAAEGKALFANSCASCHAWNGPYVGEVTPIQEIGTDPGRLDSYTYELASNQYTLFSDIFYKGEDQRFTHFRKTNGYANVPLDGLWLRAPYLHNGSVPTLRDLLNDPEQRPQTFYTGNDVLDTDNVGFVSDQEAEGDRHFFKYDTTQPGNGNEGHLYGTDFSGPEKAALVEYLKTL